jgi:hypothetical protein
MYTGGVPRLISFRGKTSVGISNLFTMDSVLNQVYRLAVKSQTKDLTDFWKPVRSHYFSSAIFPINFASIAARGIMDLSSACRLRECFEIQVCTVNSRSMRRMLAA